MAQVVRCAYCGEVVTASVHWDHIVPISRGGSAIKDVFAFSCRMCNIKKRDTTPEEWIRYVGRPFNPAADHSFLSKWPASPALPICPPVARTIACIQNKRVGLGLPRLDTLEVPGFEIITRHEGYHGRNRTDFRHWTNRWPIASVDHSRVFDYTKAVIETFPYKTWLVSMTPASLLSINDPDLLAHWYGEEFGNGNYSLQLASAKRLAQGRPA